jgi:hypothetical protein
MGNCYPLRYVARHKVYATSIPASARKIYRGILTYYHRLLILLVSVTRVVL